MAEPNQKDGRDKTPAVSQTEAVERTGRTEEVTGERRSFVKDDIPKPHDLTGPAGDPAEGKR